MSVARKDDRHNEDLVREIADSFNRAVTPDEPSESADGAENSDQPRFVVTGDQRRSPGNRRRTR